MATKKRKTKARRRPSLGQSRDSSPWFKKKRGGSKRPSLAKRLEKHGKTAKERADYAEYDRRCKAAAKEVWG